MRRIAEGMGPALPNTIRVEFTSTGGLVVRSFADGGVLMRDHVAGCILHLDAEDGLVAEVRSGAEPVPWSSAAAREAALEQIAGRRDIDEDLRRELLEHVRATPHYEDP